MQTIRRSLIFGALLFAVACAAQPVTAQTPVYYPPPGEKWERRSPEAVGMDADLLANAVAFAQSQETDFPRDFATQEKIFGRRLGPLPKEHGGTNGLVIRHGYIVAEFGDTRRPDPTYSAAKSFLSTLLGVAIDRGLIKSAEEPVAKTVIDGGYASEHNRKVTWKHHAQQTSEWEGTLWGKPHDFIGEVEFGQGKRPPRTLREPGAYYEYNDVRINRFALSLLRVFKRPLPDVLKTEVMNPIGASGTWQWVPYENAYAEVNGKRMPSVSGGTRWGGGLWISTQDEARFGLLFLRQGRWKTRQIVSEAFIREALTPGALNPDYGYLWWLNARERQWPGLPKTSFAAVGFGSNTIWIDPEHDLVVVWRWHKGNGADFFRRVVAAIKSSSLSQANEQGE
jgi:CubicO group peptidase (beta-lactamase class C family)